MRANILLIIAATLLLSCNRKIQQPVLEIGHFVDTEPLYYLQIEPISKKNGVSEVKLIDEWKPEFGIYELITNTSESISTNSIKEYKTSKNSIVVLYFDSRTYEFIKGDQYVVEIYQDKSFDLKFDTLKIQNLSQVHRNEIEYFKVDNFLTKDGMVIEIQYRYQGKYNCAEDQFIRHFKNQELNEKVIGKQLKSKLRKVMSEYYASEISNNLENGNIQQEIKNEIKISCFQLIELELIKS